MTGRRTGSALLLTLSASQFMVVLDFTIVNVALPSIQDGVHGSLAALLGTLVLLGIASRLNQVSSNIAGNHGPVAARSEGTASALLTATRQTGPALGVVILSAVLVIVHGRSNYWAEVAMFIAAGFAARRPAGQAGGAARTAAPPRAAAATPVPPPCRRNPVTTATRGQGAREIVFACPAVLRKYWSAPDRRPGFRLRGRYGRDAPPGARR